MTDHQKAIWGGLCFAAVVVVVRLGGWRRIRPPGPERTPV